MKDLDLVSRAIREQRELHIAMDEPIGAAAMAEFAEHLARDLRDHHLRFDKEAFLSACDPRPGNRHHDRS